MVSEVKAKFVPPTNVDEVWVSVVRNAEGSLDVYLEYSNLVRYKPEEEGDDIVEYLQSAKHALELAEANKDTPVDPF